MKPDMPHPLTRTSFAALLVAAVGCQGQPVVGDEEEQELHPRRPAAGPVWDSNARHVDLTCSGFFDGGMRFSADRDQLSPAQMGMLEDLRTISPSGQQCVSDVLGCTIAVTNGRGTTTTYQARMTDDSCGDDAPQIAFASLQPFLSTIGCGYSKGDRGDEPPPELAADPRCWNAVFTSGEGKIKRRLRVDSAGPKHIAASECGYANRRGKVSLTVFDADGATPLKMSPPADDPGAAGICSEADVPFPTAGVYDLVIDVAPGFLPAGDFFLRFY
jgi:hypothetical protein